MTGDDQTDRSTRLATVRRAYAGFGAPAAEECLDPGIVFTLHGAVRDIPHAGRYVGLEGVRAFASRFDTLLDCHGDGPQQFLVDGDVVIVRGFERSRCGRLGGPTPRRGCM